MMFHADIRIKPQLIYQSGLELFFRIQILIVLLLAVGACTNDKSYSQQEPNIVIIYADDVGNGDLGIYGAQKIKTPNIDNLSKQGVRFTNVYATAVMCAPSRDSLLTGKYAFRHPHSGTIVNNVSRIGYMTGGQSDWWNDKDMNAVFAKRSEQFIRNNKEEPEC